MLSARLVASLIALAMTGCVGEVRPGQVPASTASPRTDSVRWSSLPVSYCLDLGESGYVDDAAFERLVRRAFEAWGAPARDRGRCDGAMKEEDGVSQIGWGTATEPTHEGGVFQAGFTRVRFRACGSDCPAGAEAVLSEADIIVERDPPRSFRNERCLYSVLLHEAGHFLGLQHLPPPALMSPSTSSCRSDLTEADRQALSDRYGDDLTRN